MTNRTLRMVGMLVCSALILSACAMGPPPEAEPTQPPAQPTPDVQPTERPDEGVSKSFVVAFTATGFSDTPMFAAFDMLREQGYTIESHVIADPNLMVAGTAENQFNFSSGDAAVLLRAIQEGANLKIIGERVGDEWAIVTVSDITTCEELEGRSMAYHAVGSFNEVSVRAYIQENCPGTMPDEVIIAGSANRAAALLAGQIDASPVKLEDAINIIDEGGDRFSILASFNESLPDLRFAPIAVNGDFLAANPDVVDDYLEALLIVNRRIADEPGYLREIALRYDPVANEELIDEIVDEYLRYNMFDVNGGINEDNLTFTINFFVDAGDLDPGPTVADVADLSHLEAVLDRIGRR